MRNLAREIRLPYPHPGQQAVRREARRFNWLAAGRRWRKTTLVMAIAVEEAMRGKQILWCAPVFDQVRIGWTETKRAAATVAEFNQTRMTATFPGGGVITYRSLDNPDNARGHTADGVVIDECGDVAEEAWYEVLRPMLMDTGGWAWGIGTPRGFNWFYTEHQRAQERLDSRAWRVPTLGAVVRDGELYREPHPLENPAIPFAEIRDLYHTTPPAVFAREVLCEFRDDAFTIFSPTWWQAGRNRFDLADEALRHRAWGRFLSWDTALKDKDTSAYSAVVSGDLLPYGDERLLIRAAWRERLAYPALVDATRDWIHRSDADGKLNAVIIEDKASGISLVQTLQAALGPQHADLIVAFQPPGDKATRAGLASVWCRNDCVLLPTAAPWLRDFEAELYAAPFSQYMDYTDAFSQLILKLSDHLQQGWHMRGGALEGAA